MNERFECRYNWIIDNNKRNTKESLIVYDKKCDTLDDICELLNQQYQRIAQLEEQLEYFYKRDKEQEQQLEEQAKFRINSIKEYQQENQKLKYRWQELKKFVDNQANNYDEGISSTCSLIIDKMNEMENK